jgi:hypothetical protein
VTSLHTSRDGRLVTGVPLRPLDDPTGGHQQLEADLVVDACGRGSFRTPTWLAESGYATPTKTHVDPNIAYASPDLPHPGRVQRGLAAGDAG